MKPNFNLVAKKLKMYLYQSEIRKPHEIRNLQTNPFIWDQSQLCSSYLGKYLFAKRWNFSNFQAIDWPFSAYYTRTNEATELRLVLNERFLFVVGETHRVFPITFLYRHVLGGFLQLSQNWVLLHP